MRIPGFLGGHNLRGSEQRQKGAHLGRLNSCRSQSLAMQRLCVFCGSSFGSRPDYEQAAHHLGTTLAQQGVEVVYGGGRVGLMGVVADAALAAGGQVIGVIPEALMQMEIGHAGLTDLRVVNSMHERKALMADLSDGFIALPGGFGTLEEFCEVLTWSQLGFHRKPCCLLNTAGYYDRLLALWDHAVEEGFVRLENRAQVLSAHSVEEALEQIKHYQPTHTPKWIRREQL